MLSRPETYWEYVSYLLVISTAGSVTILIPLLAALGGRTKSFVDFAITSVIINAAAGPVIFQLNAEAVAKFGWSEWMSTSIPLVLAWAICTVLLTCLVNHFVQHLRRRVAHS